MRIAVLDDYLKVVDRLADWREVRAQAEVVTFHSHLGSEDQVAEALADFEIVVAQRERTQFPKSLFERLPKLKLLVTTAMRNRAIDLAAAQSCGIVVCGTPVHPYPPSELTWALILALVTRIRDHDATVRTGEWLSGLHGTLHGKTLGILGLGTLGKQVAVVAPAFGMDVVAWSRNLTDEEAQVHGARRVHLDDLLKTSDIVSIHLFLSPEMKGLISRREFELMKPTAYLVNTARGPIVDEAAMIDALQSGKIAGAGLDVYDEEPLPRDHTLRRLDNTVLVPHAAGLTEDGLSVMYGGAVEDILAYLNGSPIRVLNASA
jgi:phosphoglycerate dehydrogenase-like enzyme